MIESAKEKGIDDLTGKSCVTPPLLAWFQDFDMIYDKRN
jgi:hypothetical protein